ncbi:lipoyl(octanoyl) transferase LipB [Jiella avicenniae]|uniref:Octanoyltransferase n=1 Tax=Jiella avicenniae TaxID=2907202 RepID=A0A9X1P240_9HYPH|nr:lipoyl(octanoyl) transferase LipB [Jiella avicenniae]MCE7028354.1 lipoyl(octanoyl) transferase LipB [Jiella avicenniae]
MTSFHSSHSQKAAPSPAPRLGAATDEFFAEPGSPPVEWHVLDGLTPYPDALAAMEARVGAIADGRADEAVILLEHPPLYTAGTGAQDGDLLDRRFPVFSAGRGGQYTYHGPGQRVAYVLLDLKRRRQDVRAFVAALEAWIIATLAEFHVAGERREDRVGVWVRRPERPIALDGTTAEDKIAAIGIRVRRWVTFHGISLNVDPDLSHFSGIVPCGIRGHGVTSLADLGILVSMPEVDALLRRKFEAVFGETRAFAGDATSR